MSGVLTRPVLVLNQSWMPIHVSEVASVVTKLWNDVFKAIDPETYGLHTWEEWIELPVGESEPCIRTGKLKIKVPEVVCAFRYDKMPAAAVVYNARNVHKRDHYTCQYCGAQPGLDGVTIDHVVPKAQGGGSNWLNCVSCCAPCNAKKADRTPEQAGMKLRRQPFKPEFKAFWQEQGARVASWERFVRHAPVMSYA